MHRSTSVNHASNSFPLRFTMFTSQNDITFDCSGADRSNPPQTRKSVLSVETRCEGSGGEQEPGGHLLGCWLDVSNNIGLQRVDSRNAAFSSMDSVYVKEERAWL